MLYTFFKYIQGICEMGCIQSRFLCESGFLPCVNFIKSQDEFKKENKNNSHQYPVAISVSLFTTLPSTATLADIPKKYNASISLSSSILSSSSISCNENVIHKLVEQPYVRSNHKRETTSAIAPSVFVQQSTLNFEDRYVTEKELGSGAYGEVLLCRDKLTNCRRAIKIIAKTEKGTVTSNVLAEIQLLKQLDHPNIMKIYEFFQDSTHYYVVSDVYSGGELFDCIINRQKFTEADAAVIMKQVISGVCYLHKHNIVHRDLKPENLLFESDEKDALIKIVDFGLSSTFEPSKKMNDRLGTAYYIAPEVLKQTYDEKCDVWSCGVILYILLCGYPPFSGSNDKEIIKKVETGVFCFDAVEWKDITESVKDLIRHMLIMNPSQRFSAQECLQHEWFKLHTGHTPSTYAPCLSNAMGNMRKFRASQQLAQAALFFIGSKLTTTEETKTLTKIFQDLDTNGDGQLDRNELIQGYKLLMASKDNRDDLTTVNIEQKVDEILNCVDFDKNGTIDYSEFLTVAIDKQMLLSIPRLQQAFNLFDVDGSGKIACDEIRKILGDVNDEEWSAIAAEVDENNDGEIDFDEFVRMMQRIYNQ